MVLGIHDCLIDDLFYCVVLYGAMENNLYQTNYPSPPTPHATTLELWLQQLVFCRWTLWFQGKKSVIYLMQCFEFFGLKKKKKASG